MSKNDNNKVLFIGAIITFIITVLVVLGGFWIWAIFGMKEEVGMACTATALVFGFTCIVLFQSWIDS